MMKKFSKISGICSLRGGEEGVGTTRATTVAPRSSRDEGAILILALAYLVAVSLIVAMLSTWATGDLNNSTKFSSANSLNLAATDMTDVAIQYVRYNPLIPTSEPVAPYASPAVACWGGDKIQEIPVINGDQIAVWCSTVWSPLLYQTRNVTLTACPITVSAAACSGSNALLTANVIFDDYPPAPAHSAPIQALCSVWCGEGMTVVSWQWGASAPGSVTGVAANMVFSNEPSDTSAGAVTQASVTVTDSSGTPVAGDWVSMMQQSGPTPGIEGTLTALTNSSGIAVFTNLIPQSPGNYTLTAADGAANATSTNFVVSKQRSVINLTSTDTSATDGGTYTPTYTTSPLTGDPVQITSTTPVCTVSGGVVTFVGVGTCTLDFNDPGNSTYAPALQVTQSFPVGGMTATQVAITLTPSSPGTPVSAIASGTTNVTITMTLENAVGATVKSNGTTTVVLSDIGSGCAAPGGCFAMSEGVKGTPTLNVPFGLNSTTATAYFGDESTGPDTISAVNGTTNWGSAGLTITSGAPTQVAITPSTSSPAVSSLTNTSLAFQLEDQYGNPATSVGTTTLALSDSGNGFFSTSNGSTGTSTLNLTFAGGAGTAAAYFGNETSGADIITAQNGASVWATSTLTLAAGAASTVQVTLNPNSPTKSPTTNTSVTLQLVDQYGNHVVTGNVSLTLSDSGVGFFATKSGVSTTSYPPATSTLTVTTISGLATAYFGDSTGQSDSITVTGIGSGVTTPPFTVH